MDDIKKKYKSGISIILPFILVVIPLIIIIVMYVDIKDYRFLIAAIIEIGLAFACYTFRRYSYWMYIIVFLFSFFVPIVLAVKISQLRPIGASILVFLAALIAIHAWTKYFRRVINRTNSLKLSPKFPFIAIFPNNLLPDFMMGEYFIYKKKSKRPWKLFMKTTITAPLFGLMNLMGK
jgi:hypothetical protein